MVNNRFVFRDVYGRWTFVGPVWVANPSGEGGRPAVQFELGCGAALPVPIELLADVLVAARDAAGRAGPDSPRAVAPKASGGLVQRLPLVGEDTTCCALPRPRTEGGDADGTCPGEAGDSDVAACPGSGQQPLRDTTDTGCDTPCPGMSPQARVVKPGPACRRVLIDADMSQPVGDASRRPRRHPGADLAAECEECGTTTVLMLGGGYAACARVQAEARAEAAREEQPDTAPGRWVWGECPSCRRQTLFVGDSGVLGCWSQTCPDPGAAATVLAGQRDGWVRASEALKAVMDADDRVDHLTNRAMAVREYALTLDEPARGRILALLTERRASSPDPCTGVEGAAVAAPAAGEGTAT